MHGRTTPKRFTITGVSGDVWHGNEHTIYEPTWFVDKDGKKLYMTGSKPGWTEEDLKELQKLDKSYVLWFEPSEYIGINEGESLYLAGHRIMNTIDELIETGLLEFSFHAWTPVGDGMYLGHTMTPAAYNAFILSLATHLWDIVADYIRSGSQKQDPLIEKTMKAYLSLHCDNLKRTDKSLNRGAYCLATHNTQQFKIESFLSTLGKDKIFNTEEAFAEAAREHLRDLRRK